MADGTMDATVGGLFSAGHPPMAPVILLYGVAGLGKTSFAAQMPRPMFALTENGKPL